MAQNQRSQRLLYDPIESDIQPLFQPLEALETISKKQKKLSTMSKTLKFRTHHNGHLFKKQREKNTQPSRTIPDQSMTITEIMTRFASGLPLGGEKVPMYEGEDYMPEFKNMDLAEREEAMRLAEEELDQLKDSLNQKAKKQTSGPRKKLPAEGDIGDKNLDGSETPV